MNFFPVELRGEQIVFSQGGTVVPLDGECGGRLREAGIACLDSSRALRSRAGSGRRYRGPDQARRTARLGHADPLRYRRCFAIARIDPSLRPKVGDRLSPSPQPGKTHLFDGSDGQVLR